MSVTLTLYNFVGDKRLVNKSSNLSYSITLTGDFKGTVDITSQTISLDISLITFDDDVTILDYNYLYITEFERYYFIDKLYFVTTNLVEITTIEDPLYTYNTNIRNLYVQLLRNRYLYDESIHDDLQVYTSKLITSYISPTTTVLSTQINNYASRSFVIATLNSNSNNTISIAGGTSPFNSRVYYSMDKAVFCLSPVGAEYVVEQLSQNLTSYIQYVKSFFQVPFYFCDTSSATALYGVYVGDTLIDTYTNVGAYAYEYTTSTTITKKIESVIFDIGEDFRDLEADYYIYIPFGDYVKININEINGYTISLYFNVNLITAESTYILYNESTSKVINSGSINCCKEVNLSNEDIQKYRERQQVNAINTSIGALSSILSVGVGIATKNPVATAGGLISLGSNVAKGIQQGVTDRPEGRIEKTSTSLGWILGDSMHLKKIAREYDAVPSVNLYGRPYNRYTSLSSVTGMTLIGSHTLENFGKALTEDEENLLEQALSDYIIL